MFSLFPRLCICFCCVGQQLKLQSIPLRLKNLSHALFTLTHAFAVIIVSGVVCCSGVGWIGFIRGLPLLGPVYLGTRQGRLQSRHSRI